MNNSDLTLDLAIDAEDISALVLGQEEIYSLIVHVLRFMNLSDSWQVSILFTTDERIRDMHREFMNIDSPTDIMTFPYEQDEFTPPEELERGGDLVISVDTAAANAIDAGWSTEDELRYLILHGMLHLLGWNDTTSEDRTAMLSKQDAILASWPH